MKISGLQGCPAQGWVLGQLAPTAVSSSNSPSPFSLLPPPGCLQIAARGSFPKSLCKLTRSRLSTVLRMASKSFQVAPASHLPSPPLPLPCPLQPFQLPLRLSFNPRLLRDTSFSFSISATFSFSSHLFLNPVYPFALFPRSLPSPGQGMSLFYFPL